MAQGNNAQPSTEPSTALSTEPLLQTVDLTRHFRLGGMFSKNVLHAVDDFNLAIHEREIVLSAWTFYR